VYNKVVLRSNIFHDFCREERAFVRAKKKRGRRKKRSNNGNSSCNFRNEDVRHGIRSFIGSEYVYDKAEILFEVIRIFLLYSLFT